MKINLASSILLRATLTKRICLTHFMLMINLRFIRIPSLRHFSTLYLTMCSTSYMYYEFCCSMPMKKSKVLVLLSRSCTLLMSLINFSFLSISFIVYLLIGIWNPEHPKSLFNLLTSFIFSWFKILFYNIVLSMSSSFMNFYRVSKVRPNLSVVTLEKLSGSFIATWCLFNCNSPTLRSNWKT